MFKILQIRHIVSVAGMLLFSAIPCYILRRQNETTEIAKKISVLALTLLSALVLVCNLFGSEIVYRSRRPHYMVNPSNPRYCSHDLFLASISAVTITNLVFGIAVIAVLCSGGFLAVAHFCCLKLRTDPSNLQQQQQLHLNDIEMCDWIEMRGWLRSPPSYEEAVAEASVRMN
jgi:hypothetical protein